MSQRRNLKKKMLTTFLIQIPFYAVFIYTGNLIQSLKLSLTMMYIDRIYIFVFSLFQYKINYLRNIEYMDRFREVIKLPIEEGYLNFDRDQEKYARATMDNC